MIESYLTIKGLKHHYKAWGKAQKPVIIALHGWLDNANSFDLIAPILSEHYYVIALDLPGHGHSSHLPEACHYHFIDGIYHVLDFIEALQLDKFILLGHSMGACLASLIAGISTGISQLILIEGLGPLSHPANTCNHQLNNFRKGRERLAKKTSRPHESLNSAVRARAQSGYLSEELAKIIVSRGIEEIAGKFYWRHDKRLLSPSPLRLTEEQVLDCLSQIHCNTLLIEGEQGFAYQKDLMETRKTQLRNLSYQKLPGGHHIHMEKPQEMNQLIFNFLQNH